MDELFLCRRCEEFFCLLPALTFSLCYLACGLKKLLPLRAIAYPRSLSTAPGLLHTLLMIFESPAPRKEPLALVVFS